MKIHPKFEDFYGDCLISYGDLKIFHPIKMGMEQKFVSIQVLGMREES